MLKSKDTELEIKKLSPVFKLPLFSLQLCLPLFGADSVIRLKLHLKKEGTLLQTVTWWACLVLANKMLSATPGDAVAAVVIALGHAEPFNYSPGRLNIRHPQPPNHNHILVVTK